MNFSKHFISINHCDKAQLERLIARTHHYVTHPFDKKRCAEKTLALLFFEPSTRTRCSFELAGKRLGMDVIQLDCATSSTVKGETVLDTLDNLAAMGVDAFVIRHQQEGLCEALVKQTRTQAIIVNAGNGTQTHPSQALLDMATIAERKPHFSELSVAILGDVRHSRVAHSDIEALRTLGTKDIRLIGPTIFMPEQSLDGCERFSDVNAALKNVDVIIVLRIQKERMQQSEVPDRENYFIRYGLTPDKLAYAKPDALVMHPGPMNREVEIASVVADGAQSVILQQVKNGVAARMAILEELLEK